MDDDDYEERPRRRSRRRPADEDDDFGDYEAASGEDRLPRSELRAIGGYQRAIMLCILGYLCLIPVQFAIPPDMRWVLLVALVALGLTATVFVFLLSTKVYSTVTGVVLGILTLIPLVGLIVLLIINGKATSILKAHGIPVGFLGARTSDI